MTEIEDLLTRFNVDSRNSRLRDYYNSDNIWRSLQIERDENRHSAFIAWLLKKDALQDNSPFHKLLNLIVRRKDSEDADYNELKKSILKGQLKLRSIQVTTEKTVSRLSQIHFNDRIDIYANCEITGVGDYSQLEVFIENKIDSSEGTCKVDSKKFPVLTQEDELYRKKTQTERYYYACSKEYNLRSASFDRDHTLQLFVFLDAKKRSPTDNHFVTISYQDLVDFILEPYLLREDIDSHTSMCVREYLRVLGLNPTPNTSIMATTSEEKELLKDFYTRNEDLFKRALEVMRDNAESDEEEKEYDRILESIDIKRKARRLFTVNGDEKGYKMYEVIAEFVKYLRQKGETVEAIDDIIKRYTKEAVCHISENKSLVRRSEKSYEDYYDGVPFYVTKEWGLGNDGRNFDGFCKGVKKEYPEFVIEQLQ